MCKTGTVLSLVVEVHGPGEGLHAGPGCRGLCLCVAAMKTVEKLIWTKWESKQVKKNQVD